MNQSIEAVKARDRADQSTTLYFGDPETYRAARRTAPPWPYDSYERLEEALRRSDELDRMAAQWATANSSAYVADAAQMADTPAVYVADTAAAATSAT